MTPLENHVSLITKTPHKPAPMQSEPYREPLRLTRASDLGDPKPVDYVLKGLLNRGDLAMIYGKPGSGKSLFAAHLFYRVSQGAERAYGKRIKGGPVIYICLEGQGGFRRRLQALEKAHGPAPDFYLVEQAVSLTELANGFVDDLIRHAQSLEAVAIVIDTWAQATGGDESGSEANQRALSTINRIRLETRALVCVIDHQGWGNDPRPRGWSGKWAATDTALRVDGDIKAGDVLLVPERSKDGTDFAPLAFGSERASLGFDPEGDPIEVYRGLERDAATAESMTKRKPGKGKGRRLTDEQRQHLATIRTEAHAIGKADQREGRSVTVIDRVTARDALIRAERIFVAERNGPVTKPVTEDVLTNSERQKVWRVLNTLRDKGKLGFDDNHVWVFEADQEGGE